MIKSMSARVALFVAVALLASAVGYRTLVREQSRRAVLPDSELADQILVPSDEERSTNAAVGVSQADQSLATVGPNGLHQDLLAMPERYRNHILWMTLRDAGFKCDEVRSSQLLGAETGAWRAHCGGISTYSIVIDEFGSISVDPILYGDFER